MNCGTHNQIQHQRRRARQTHCLLYYSYLILQLRSSKFVGIWNHHIARVDLHGTHHRLEIPKSFARSGTSVPLPTQDRNTSHSSTMGRARRPPLPRHPASLRLLGPRYSGSFTNLSPSLPPSYSLTSSMGSLKSLRSAGTSSPASVPFTFMPQLKAGWALSTPPPPQHTQATCSSYLPHKQNTRGEGPLVSLWAPPAPTCGSFHALGGQAIPATCLPLASNSLPAIDQGLQLQAQLLPPPASHHCHHPHSRLSHLTSSTEMPSPPRPFSDALPQPYLGPLIARNIAPQNVTFLFLASCPHHPSFQLTQSFPSPIH